MGIDARTVDGTTSKFCDARYPGGWDGGCWEIVQFHPAYGYDDFVRGIQAKTEDGKISYQVVSRVLDKLVKEHRKRDNPTTVLIIDEINRANLAQVLGELIYGLEYRDSPVQTTYEIGKEHGTLAIPRGRFFIIGTMNTADRSIGRIDYAVRRRFAFLQLNPNRDVILRQADVPQADRDWAAALFDNVSTLFNSAGPAAQRYLAQEFHPDDVRVGHTYFLGPRRDVRLKFAYQVYPLLREYYKDGVLLPQGGKIEFALPSGEPIDLVEPIDPSDLLPELDKSRAAGGGDGT